MRVERLIAGWFTAPAGLFRHGDDMHTMIRYPVPVYLVETATERILIDTGMDPAAIQNPGGYYERPDIFHLFTLEQEQSLAEQIDLATVTQVVLTHLHWDHVGGLRSIPASVPLVIQSREWNAGHDQATIRRNAYLPRDYANGRRQITFVDGDHDLLGDGSITLLHTPGHTPGHQSVCIGDLVLAADVVHFASTLDDHRFPIFADDHAAQANSALRLREIRDAGATVLPGHDPTLIAAHVLSRQ